MTVSNEPKPPLVLTIEERRSPLFRKLMAHWEQRLTSLRAQNDSDLDEVRTSRLRGLLAEVKANLSLDRDPKEFESPPR